MKYTSTSNQWGDLAELVNTADDVGLPVETHGPTTIDFFIHEGSQDQCRFAFASLVNRLQSRFLHSHRTELLERSHGNTIQHIYTVFFGTGKAAYRVVWIEKDVFDA